MATPSLPSSPSPQERVQAARAQLQRASETAPLSEQDIEIGSLARDFFVKKAQEFSSKKGPPQTLNAQDLTYALGEHIQFGGSVGVVKSIKQFFNWISRGMLFSKPDLTRIPVIFQRVSLAQQALVGERGWEGGMQRFESAPLRQMFQNFIRALRANPEFQQSSENNPFPYIINVFDFASGAQSEQPLPGPNESGIQSGGPSPNASGISTESGVVDPSTRRAIPPERLKGRIDLSAPDETADEAPEYDWRVQKPQPSEAENLKANARIYTSQLARSIDDYKKSAERIAILTASLQEPTSFMERGLSTISSSIDSYETSLRELMPSAKIHETSRFDRMEQQRTRLQDGWNPLHRQYQPTLDRIIKEIQAEITKLDQAKRYGQTALKILDNLSRESQEVIFPSADGDLAAQRRALINEGQALLREFPSSSPQVDKASFLLQQFSGTEQRVNQLAEAYDRLRRKTLDSLSRTYSNCTSLQAIQDPVFGEKKRYVLEWNEDSQAFTMTLAQASELNTRDYAFVPLKTIEGRTLNVGVYVPKLQESTIREFLNPVPDMEAKATRDPVLTQKLEIYVLLQRIAQTPL
jgi:hypothetical protein